MAVVHTFLVMRITSTSGDRLLGSSAPHNASSRPEAGPLPGRHWRAWPNCLSDLPPLWALFHRRPSVIRCYHSAISSFAARQAMPRPDIEPSDHPDYPESSPEASAWALFHSRRCLPRHFGRLDLTESHLFHVEPIVKAVGSEEAHRSASFRPPLKLHVRVSRMQLLRRLPYGDANEGQAAGGPTSHPSG